VVNRPSLDEPSKFLNELQGTVKAMEEDKGFKEEVKELIDGVLPLIRKEGQ